MSKREDRSFARLRALDPQPVVQDGRELLVLRDPLQISDKMVAVPYELAPLLFLCDGTRDSSGLRASLLVRYGLQVSPQIIDRFLAVCDEALLLDNEHFRDSEAALLSSYRAAAFRPPALAGLSYPADPAELAELFDSYLDGTGPVSNGRRDVSAGGASPLAGVISPHIDYPRGGPVYAAVWQEAAELVRSADLAIVFGTDHYGGAGEMTLTHQSYATPFGVLPTPGHLVDALARAIGPERAFASELHHRSEHSIELALTWLHYERRDLPPVPVLPVLCGSFHQFVAGQARPESDPAISALVHTLAELTAGQRVLVVAGADLAHVGPAFGGVPQGPAECSRVQSADQAIIARTCACDAQGFFESVREVGDRFNVCGLPPIYLTLRTLSTLKQFNTGHTRVEKAAQVVEASQYEGRLVAYDTCPADDAGTSFVSITGVILE